MRKNSETPRGTRCSKQCCASRFCKLQTLPSTRRARRAGCVCVRHLIKIERITVGDSGNQTHVLNPEQNKWRPQKIQQLHGHEQNPQRDLVLLRFNRERDTVMPDKHCSFRSIAPALEVACQAVASRRAVAQRKRMAKAGHFSSRSCKHDLESCENSWTGSRGLNSINRRGHS